jgi:hypothetical protein
LLLSAAVTVSGTAFEAGSAKELERVTAMNISHT